MRYLGSDYGERPFGENALHKPVSDVSKSK